MPHRSHSSRGYHGCHPSPFATGFEEKGREGGSDGGGEGWGGRAGEGERVRVYEEGGVGGGGGGQRGMLVVEVDGGEVVEFDTCPGMDRLASLRHE